MKRNLTSFIIMLVVAGAIIGMFGYLAWVEHKNLEFVKAADESARGDDSNASRNQVLVHTGRYDSNMGDSNRTASVNIDINRSQNDLGCITFSVMNHWGYHQVVFFDEGFDGTLDYVMVIAKDSKWGIIKPDTTGRNSNWTLIHNVDGTSSRWERWDRMADPNTKLPNDAWDDWQEHYYKVRREASIQKAE